ncbi:PucR family transcriptional regulator [Lihuaxuella thermophila]|uniref:Purine catabolism regulatory protein n=1 Tax=Lihuaxuella thermophila TaxID=1173111 RepID=A0A1H8J9E6_9BACL|nr:PucR family transcriptional regulator [Lihuaxuella thermophila]SEN77553.1 purine catabolism regulatory protein [Lihuaxuella thermophila]
MHFESVLTLSDVLKRPVFQKARVVAGKNGLNRRIRWVHILEVSQFDTLIHGEEMILFTGINFQSSSVSPVSYLQKLIELNASCLCVEMGYYFDTIPKEMIRLADQHDFPLIALPAGIRFVDITQDLHSLIINRHYHMLKNLENLSREFHRLTLAPKGISNILKLLYQRTKSQIIYVPLKGKAFLMPSLDPGEQEELLDFIRTKLRLESSSETHPIPYSWPYKQKTILLHPVRAMGQTWAFIGMLCEGKPAEYDCLILDWSSLSIAQDLLRKRYIEERRLHSENVWVDDLLRKRISEEQIRYHLGTDYKELKDLKSLVCLIEIRNWNEIELEPSLDVHEFIRYDFSLMIRSTFEQYGFRPFITINNDRIAIVAFDRKPAQPLKPRFRQVVASIQRLGSGEKMGLSLNIGAGQSYPGFTHAHLSYQEAGQVLTVNTSQQKTFLFYEEIGVFQLILNLREEGNILQSFVHNYLGPLIEHDRQKGSNLLYTLKVYLDHDGSKKEAAQHLFIVRQSLYYRLEKIKELLGDNFMSPENKLALQVALRACQLFYPELLAQQAEETDPSPQ